MTISGAIYREWGGRLLDLITVHYVISGRRSRFSAFQGITQNLRWQMIDHSFPGKSKASQNKWLPWESLQASQVSQSYSGQSHPLKASAVFGPVVLLMVLALVLLLLTSAARVTIVVQGVMGQRRRPSVAPSSPPLNGPADILILAGKTKILIHGKCVTLENKNICYFNLCTFLSTGYHQTRCEVLCTRCCNVYNSDALQEAMKMSHSIAHSGKYGFRNHFWPLESGFLMSSWGQVRKRALTF